MPTNYFSLIIHPETQNFLLLHEQDDEKQLVLKQKQINGIPSSIIASQLSSRKKAKTKLPTWYKTNGVVYPPTIKMEQCSSEATGIFKSSIVSEIESSIASAFDLTGGFGVDAYFLSKKFEAVHYVEPDDSLVELTKHNHRQLGATNITHHCSTAENFIAQSNLKFDLAFIDPSRRDDQSRRVYKLADCTPDITLIQSALFDKCRFILLKASPLLDIQQGLREFIHVKKVIVVSVGNECKELLFLAEKGFVEEPMIEAVDLFENGTVKSSVSFLLSAERNATVSYSEPGHFLYEPNASILKAGAFKWIAEKFSLPKLDANTHLYTSTEVIQGFPGKVFLIVSLNPDAKQLKEFFPKAQANVVSRNYPLSTDEIKRKYHLRDGGVLFLLGFSASKRKFLAICKKITNT